MFQKRRRLNPSARVWKTEPFSQKPDDDIDCSHQYGPLNIDSPSSSSCQIHQQPQDSCLPSSPSNASRNTSTPTSSSSSSPPTTKTIPQSTRTPTLHSNPGDVGNDRHEILKGLSEALCSGNNANYPPKLDEWLHIFHQWTNSERLVALEKFALSEICDFRQIGFLLSLIEPQLQRDFIGLLPKEVALYILSFLEPEDLLRASQTCRYWRILCEDNLMWRERCREEGILGDQEMMTMISDLFKQRVSRKNRKSSFSSFSPSPAPSSSSTPSPSLTPTPQPPSSSPSSSSSSAIAVSPSSSSSSSTLTPSTEISQTTFTCSCATADSCNCSLLTSLPFSRSEYKIAYLRMKYIEHNWRFGRFPSGTTDGADSDKKHRQLREIMQLNGHDDHVITCLQFDPHSNLIVSGSDDNTLKVWSASDGRCLRTLVGHTGGVWASQLSPDHCVISGSTDRTLRVWDALTGVCKFNLYGHTSTVRCMSLRDKHVVSGSRDASLRVWNIETGHCVHVLTGHQSAVRCVQFDGKTVVSGAYDNLVKVWDVATETCLHTLHGHTNRVYSLQFDGENIVSGSLDTTIRVWSANTGEAKHTLTGHTSLTSGMQLKGSLLVSGNADSTVKVWNINTGKCLRTLAGTNKHQSAVTCLQFNSKFVITSSDDGTVKLWDLKTGQFIRNLVSLASGGSGGVVWRIRASNTKVVCAVGSRNGTEETKLLVLDFADDTMNCRPSINLNPEPMKPTKALRSS